MILSPQEEVRYVPREDRDLPAEDQTVFIFSPVSVRTERGISRTARARRDMCDADVLRVTLSGWENLRVRDSEGNINPAEPKYDSDGFLTEESLDLLGTDVRAELVEQALKVWRVDKGEEGNSRASSPPTVESESTTAN